MVDVDQDVEDSGRNRELEGIEAKYMNLERETERFRSFFSDPDWKTRLERELADSDLRLT